MVRNLASVSNDMIPSWLPPPSFPGHCFTSVSLTPPCGLSLLHPIGFGHRCLNSQCYFNIPVGEVLMLALSLRMCSLPLSRTCNLLPGMISHVKRTLVRKPFTVWWPGVGDRKHQRSDEVSVFWWGWDPDCGPQVLLSVTSSSVGQDGSSCLHEWNALAGPKQLSAVPSRQEIVFSNIYYENLSH